MPDPSPFLQEIPRYLTQDEVRRLFGVIDSARDRALFAILYLYGLRVGEVAFLRVGDIDLERSRIVVRRSKGGVWTERPIFSVVARLLRRYFGTSALALDDPLFLGRSGPLQKRQIQSLFARYRDLAGLRPALTCHGLRHAIATHLLDAGCSLEFVQDHLGHRTIRSTSIYARISDQNRLGVFQRLEASPWIVYPTWHGEPSPGDADYVPEVHA
ncbi:MAG: site-specific integrase [Candidatus Eisenbacteria bacterium]